MKALPVVWMGGKSWYVDERLGEVRSCANPHLRLTLDEFVLASTVSDTGSWLVEETGGGCQWLRRGSFAITDGDAGLPESGQPCLLITLDGDGDYADEGKPFGSPEAAAAYVKFCNTHYNKRGKK